MQPPNPNGNSGAVAESSLNESNTEGVPKLNEVSPLVLTQTNPGYQSNSNVGLLAKKHALPTVEQPMNNIEKNPNGTSIPKSQSSGQQSLSQDPKCSYDNTFEFDLTAQHNSIQANENINSVLNQQSNSHINTFGPLDQRYCVVPLTTAERINKILSQHSQTQNVMYMNSNTLELANQRNGIISNRTAAQMNSISDRYASTKMGSTSNANMSVLFDQS